MREDDTDSPRESDAARARAHANDCIGTVAFISIFSLFSAFNVQKGGERKRERERERAKRQRSSRFSFSLASAAVFAQRGRLARSPPLLFLPLIAQLARGFRMRSACRGGARVSAPLRVSVCQRPFSLLYKAAPPVYWRLRVGQVRAESRRARLTLLQGVYLGQSPACQGRPGRRRESLASSCIPPFDCSLNQCQMHGRSGQVMV